MYTKTSGWLVKAMFSRLIGRDSTVSRRRPRGSVPRRLTLTSRAPWSRFESLESRAMLAANLYVDQSADYLITTDIGSTGLTAGDTVTWRPGSAAEVSGLTYGTNAFGTIGTAITTATAGDTINVAPGTFSENVAVSKSLTLLGAQAGVKATGTARTGDETLINGTGASSSFVVHVQADNVTIDGFAINPRINPSDATRFARDAINVRTDHVAKPGESSIGAYRTGVTIRNNWIYSNIGSLTGQQQGITFGESPQNNNPSAAVNAEVANVSVTDNYINMVNTAASGGPRGIVLGNQFQGTLPGTSTKASILYTNITIDGNTVFASNVPLFQSQNQTRLGSVSITGNTFGNSRGGVSIAATMTDSSFSNNTIQDVSAGTGLTLCLVNSTASGNTIRRIGGAAFVLSGGRSTDPTYFAPSANSTISNNTISYNDVALPGGSTQVTGLNVQPNLNGSGNPIAGTTGVDANTITLSGNTFTNGNVNSSVAVAAIAQLSVGTTLDAVNATPNTFNGVPLTMSTSTADLFAIADQAADVVDATNLGAVSLKSGAVYVTPASFWSPSSTTAGSVQRGVDASSAGQTVQVKAGTYGDTVSITTPRTILGPNADVAGSGTRAAEAIVSGGFIVNGGSHVTISGFSVTGTDAAGSRGVLLGNTGTVPGPVTVSNNIIDRWTTGISLAGGATYPWVSGVTVSGNLIRNNTAGIGSTENVDGLTVTANAFSGNTEGIGLGPGLTDLSISGNTFASSNGAHIAAYGEGLMPDYPTLVADNTFGTFALVSETTGADYTTASIYSSLSSAIANAAENATVTALAGTYAPVTIGVAGVTVKTIAGAVIQGADAEGATVRFAADNVRLEGFTIDNGNAADGRAIAPQGSSGGQIVDNTIRNAFRGIQGDFYGRPTNITITGNTFESTVSYGLAGSEDMSITALSGNTFNTSEEAIGLGQGVSGVTPSGLMANNTFALSAVGDGDTYGVKDYRDNTIYVKTGDSLQAAINGATAGDTVLVPAGTWGPISIGVAGVTVKTTVGALIQGADAEGATVRFAADNVRLEGFTIDNGNAADGRAIAPQGSSGGQIVDNTIRNAFRGIQGDFYGRPTNITITGNTFESTVSYGLAGSEDMSITALSGNTFNTSEEAIGLGDGVSGVTPSGLMANNTFALSAAGDGNTYGVKDYRDNTIYVKDGDSLQAAINGASSGDTVLVAAGTYAPIEIVSPLTVKTTEAAIIQGANADGATVLVNNNVDVRIEGFTIDNQNAADGRAIFVNSYHWGMAHWIVGNTFRNAQTGFASTYMGTLTVNDNVFESSVSVGLEIPSLMFDLFASGNTFSTSTLAIGLDSANIGAFHGALNPTDIYNLLASQTFLDYSGQALRDSSTESTYVPVKLASDTGGSSTDRITKIGTLVVTPADGELLEYSVDNGLTWSDSFTAAEGPNAVMVRRVGSTRTDSEPQAFAFALDRVQPTVAIAASRDGMPVAALKAGDTATITFTLSEPSTNFTVDDVSYDNGILSGFTGSGTLYTATFVPDADVEAVAAISVEASQFTDTAGNDNDASSVVSLDVDTIVPSIVSVTSSRAVLKATQTAVITFTLNAPSTTFTAGDVVATGGTLSNFAGSGTLYTATFTPTANFSGTGTVRVLSGSFFDLAGNQSTEAFDLAPVIDVQTNGPAVTSITAATNPVRIGNATSQITVTLNKHVATFNKSHISITPGAGSVSDLVRVGTTSSYRTTFTPTAGYVGTVAISVADDVFKDTADNWNVGGSLATPLNVDLVVPDVTISSSSAFVKARETATITFSFTEPVVGFAANDVTVAGGTLSGFTGSGTTYTALFTPRANSTTPGSISVAANRYSDAVGNANVQRQLSPTLTVNTVVPTMTISQRIAVLKAGQSTTVTFQIRGQTSASDPFTRSDITLAPNEGSLSDLTYVGYSRNVQSYTAVYTAPSGSFTGTVGLFVPANSFKVDGNDVNGNAAASLQLHVDSQGPSPVLSTNASALKIGQTATIDFTIANETANVVGFEAGDISLAPASGTISAPARVPGTNVYRAIYTPAVGFEGPVTLALSAGKFTDAAGNPNIAGNSITIAVDTMAPVAPAVALVNDTGAFNNDKITSDAQLTATGTETGASLQYWANVGLTAPWTPALAVQGPNTVYVTQTDTAGNPSLAAAFAFEYRTAGPAPASITLAAASTGLVAGRFVELRVAFARPVFVTGETTNRPFITIGGFTTGESTRRAVYASGSGSTTLVFRYQVAAGDKALTGITYPASAITLEGATILDAAGNAASLPFTLPSRRPVTRVNA